MRRIFLAQTVLTGLFFMIFMKPVQSAGNELIEQLRNPALSVEEQEQIIKTQIRFLERGIDFFLSEDIEHIPKPVQKMVLQQMIKVGGGGSMTPKVTGFSSSQRRKAADRYIPLVDFASEAAHIFLWDNKKETGSLIVDSFMTESQMRELVKRGRIMSVEEGTQLLASRPANFPADELPGIVADIRPHFNSSSNGSNIFSVRGATHFGEGTTDVNSRAPVSREVIDAYRLPESLITDIIDDTLPYTDTAHKAGSLLSVIAGKHPEYPLTNLFEHALSVINTGQDAVDFSGYGEGIFRNLSPDQQGQFIRHTAPLITHKDQAAEILKRTRRRLPSYEAKRGMKFQNYLSEEDTKAFIDDTNHLFDSPDELKELDLEREELKYARKAMKNPARSGGPRRAEANSDTDGRVASGNKGGKLDCLRRWLSKTPK